MKAQTDAKVGLKSLLTSAMAVSGQPHAPTILPTHPSGERAPVSVEQGAVWAPECQCGSE